MFSHNLRIPYSELGNIFPDTSLFYNYINSFDKIRNLYQWDYRNLDDVFNSTKNILFTSEQRKSIHHAIIDYNKKYNNSQQVLQNIDSLLDENTYTIFTGQQCGVLTGPLYTIYKAMTAIQLSKILSAKGREKFIPVFWIASEDHDIGEVNHIDFPVQDGNLHREYLNIESHKSSIQDIPLNDAFILFLDVIKGLWNQTEFTDKIFELFYHSLNKLSESFAHLMSYLFKEEGLILVEPYLLRELSVPLNEIILDKNTEIQKCLYDNSDQLKSSGLSPAVTWDNALNLFYYHNNKRTKLYPNKDCSELESKEGDFKLSYSELKKSMNNDPSLISHNVITRPIIQDSLFPNAITVCGPGEIAYFSQLKGVYSLFQKKMPVIYPRVSVTLIQKKFQKTIDRFQVTLKDILNCDTENIDKLFKQFENNQSIRQFEENIHKEIQRLLEDAQKRGKDLSDAIIPLMRKVEHEILKLKEKYIKKLEEISGVSRHQFTRLENNIIPKNKLQERVFNVFYYLNYYGDNMIKELLKIVDVCEYSHQVLFYE